MEGLMLKLWEFITFYGIKIVTAVVIFVVGRWIAKGLEKVVRKVTEVRKVDLTLISFLANLTYIAVLTFVVIAALGQLGIQTTSFVAVIGAAGLAVGLAFQGSLSNFASGFLMIVFRPFNVGDFIEGGGTSGVVEKIEIFTTQLITADNRTIIIPNSKITSGDIVNWSAKEARRVDMTISLAYSEDIDKAKQIVAEILAQDDRILKDPPPVIGIAELSENCVKLGVCPWVNPTIKVGDYPGFKGGILEAIVKRFGKEGFAVPYPQRVLQVIERKS